MDDFLQIGAGVTSMAWSAEKFKLEEDEEEDEDEEDRDDDDHDDDYDCGVGSGSQSSTKEPRQYVLAVSLADGKVVLLRSFDDVSPITINTGLKPPLQTEWSNSRKMLAVAGVEDADFAQHHQQSNSSVNFFEYTNLVKFYNDKGCLIYTIAVPFTQVNQLF